MILNNTVLPILDVYLANKQLFYQFHQFFFLAKLLLSLRSKETSFSFFPENTGYHMKFFKHFPLLLWFCSSACFELFQKKISMSTSKVRQCLLVSPNELISFFTRHILEAAVGIWYSN